MSTQEVDLTNCPIVVDLDGTLIYSDMLHETALTALVRSPRTFIEAPFWLAKGKAFLKQQLASRAGFKPHLLPYNEDLLSWLKEQMLAGRSLVLCTASDRSIADQIAEHLGLFTDVMASDGNTNLAGDAKARALVERFGEAGYDYVGNSKADLIVWAHARCAIVVNASTDVLGQAQKIASVDKVFPQRQNGVSSWSRMLRVHQWLKNVLIFMPLLAAHDLTNKNH